MTQLPERRSRTRPAPFEVLDGGTLTTVQDFPGRLGYWDVGVPPSGPMDSLSFRLGNQMLGNAEGAPGLECTVTGPSLRFHCDTDIVLTGADFSAGWTGSRLPPWTVMRVRAGSVLETAGVRRGRARGPTCCSAAGSMCRCIWAAPAPSRWASSAGTPGARCGPGDVLHLGQAQRAEQVAGAAAAA